MMRALILCLALTACAPGRGGGLTVEVLDVAPQAIDPARDEANDLMLWLRYFDGDGDLGGGLVEIHDCRSQDLVTRVPLPPIASREAIERKVAIEGDLKVRLSDVGSVNAAALPALCTALGVEGVTTARTAFCVVLVDAAGNRSAGDCTGPIAIKP
jgi:hypothetical protein